MAEKKKRGRPTSDLTIQVSTKISPEAVAMLDTMAKDNLQIKARILDRLIKQAYAQHIQEAKSKP